MGTIYQQIQSELQSQSAVSTPIGIHQQADVILLFGRSFEITGVNGDIDDVELRCEHKMLELDSEQYRRLNLEQTWGQCRLVVFGDIGTSATLIQFL